MTEREINFGITQKKTARRSCMKQKDFLKGEEERGTRQLKTRDLN